MYHRLNNFTTTGNIRPWASTTASDRLAIFRRQWIFIVQAKNQSRFFVFDAQTCLSVSCRPWLWHKRDKTSYNRDRADEKRVWFWSWWWEDLRGSYAGETSLQLVWRHLWDGFNTGASRLDTFPHGPETLHRRSEPAVRQMVFVHQFTVVRRSWAFWSGHILIKKKCGTTSYFHCLVTIHIVYWYWKTCHQRIPVWYR